MSQHISQQAIKNRVNTFENQANEIINRYHELLQQIAEAEAAAEAAAAASSANDDSQ